MGKIKNLVYGLLATATLTGTLGGTEGGLNPIAIRKTGTSYGINLGVNTTFYPGSKHYGLNLSGATAYFGGKIHGASISIAQGPQKKGENDPIREQATINGLEFSILANFSDKEVKYQTVRVNGIQASIFGNAQSEDSKGVQIGIYNEKGKRRSLLINF